MSHAPPPFFCPYCGEEDIRPFGERHGDWTCGSCRRAWTLRSILAPAPEALAPEAPAPEAEPVRGGAVP